MAEESTAQVLTKKDFVAPNDVRWCPGCGDYAILNAVQTTFPRLGVPRERFVVISGIGCSSRFPYYMNTYGFHTIHGRAPTIATGVKVANPELSVWVVTGDGDGLSIGGNHLLHLLRRNVDVNVLLFNNRIYGLTKGQYSPTSEQGKRTKSSPLGSIENPINPLCFALAAEASFVARTVDTNPKHMAEIFQAAHEHKGTSFVEIMQNCVIFNDKTWAPVSGRDVREDQLVVLEEGKPLIFGQDKNKGLIWKGFRLEVVTIGEDGIEEKDLLVHRPDHPAMTYSYLLTQMSYPDLPTPIGVFRNVEGKETFEDMIAEQIQASIMIQGRTTNLQSLIRGNDYWEVEKDRKTIRMPKVKKEEVDPQILDEFEIMDEQAKETKKYESDPLVLAIWSPLRRVQEQYDFGRLKVLKPDDTVAKALSLFKVYHLGCMLVQEKGELVGILTDRDIVNRCCLKDIKPEKTKVSEIMTKSPEVIKEGNTIADAINRLSSGGFRHLPVEDKDGKFSVISIPHLLSFIYDSIHD